MGWTPPGSDTPELAHRTDPHQHNQEETNMDGTTVAVDLATPRKDGVEVAVANERGQIIDRKRLGRA